MAMSCSGKMFDTSMNVDRKFPHFRLQQLRFIAQRCVSDLNEYLAFRHHRQALSRDIPRENFASQTFGRL